MNVQAQARFELFRAPSHFGYELRISAVGLTQLPNGDVTYSGRSTHIAQPLVFKEYEKGALTSSCIGLDQDEAEDLMNALWKCGLRPSNGEGNVGQIGALKDHLEDKKTDKEFYKGMIREAFRQNKGGQPCKETHTE